MKLRDNSNFMTDKDFNNFLKTVNLKSCYTDKNINNRYFFSVDNGWLGLIKKLILDLFKNGWNGQIAQVKEKFGGLRFYIGHDNDAIFDLISEAEGKSYEICETCGDVGELNKTNGWLKTVCPIHKKE